MTEILSILLLLFGCIFILIAGVGVVRLPDTMCRAHAISKALTLGMMLALLALLIMIGTYAALVKVTLAILFQFVTIPIGGHIFALYSSSVRPDPTRARNMNSDV